MAVCGMGEHAIMMGFHKLSTDTLLILRGYMGDVWEDGFHIGLDESHTDSHGGHAECRLNGALLEIGCMHGLLCHSSTPFASLLLT